MKVSWAAGVAFVVALIIGVAGASLLHLKGPEYAIFVGLLGALGLGAAAAVSYFQSKAEKQAASPPAGAPGGPGAEGGNSELDTLIREANTRLSQSNVSQGAAIAGLPLIFVIGDRGMAKTSTVLNSGLEPELLSGHVFQDNAVASTRAANVWFARGHVFVEAGGAVLGDPASWSRLVKRLQPGKLKSIGKGAQSPRAVLLCFSLEAFAQPGGSEAVTAAARYLQARLGDISQLLGISFPVYLLFTKTDRVPFFDDFVRMLSNEEATQVFGATVPMRTQATGIYAEEETRRLTEAFNKLFDSLCEKRTVFLPREDDAEKRPGAYEFPREFRKLRTSLVQFMVDVCRPSQLRASPFLRGFYFSGVRPVVVNDAAPVPMLAREAQPSGELLGGGATGMFRVGKQAENVRHQMIAQPGGASRKVPQWLFLGHLFNDVILRDGAAMGASGASVKTSLARRILLASAAGLCLLCCIFLLVSFSKNRSLEREAQEAAQNIKAGDGGIAAPMASLESLGYLEALRQSLEKLTRYENDGAPLSLRWGLYRGSDMYPEVRKIYYQKFHQLLFGQTQSGLLAFLQRTPPSPGQGDDYGYAYATLKGYLLTASEYKRTSDKSLQQFLRDLLLVRWIGNREQAIGKDRIELATKQFDFYSQDLRNGNPFPIAPDAESAEGRARVYLSKFSGTDRVYQGLLTEAAKKGPSLSFNQKFAGSSETVLSATPVAYGFTKAGFDFMQKEIKNKRFGGEEWVLGKYPGQSAGNPEMEQGIRERYTRDYVKQWRTLLSASHVRGYKDVKDAAQKLNQLSGNQSRLLELLWWTTQNTAIDSPEIAQPFRAVHMVEPPSGEQRYVVPANQPYVNALMKLQGTIEQAANTPTPDAAMGKAIKDDAQAAIQTTRQISSSFPNDEGHVQTIVENLLLEPITNAANLSSGIPISEINGKGKAFCDALGPITRKFPFTPGAQPEVTLDELGAVFRPKEGKLWTFYDSALKPILQCSAVDCITVPNAPVTVNAAFVRFLSQAMRFSRALYGDSGTEPNFKYTLRPQKSEIVEEFDITVNGETAQLPGGASKNFQWPGSAPRNFKLSFKPLGFGPPSRDGLWAVFRFFADADRTVNTGGGYEFFWTQRSGQGGAPMEDAKGRPVTYEFTLDTGGAPAVFSKDFLSGLKCVSTVAH